MPPRVFARAVLLAVAVALAPAVAGAQDSAPFLLQQPAVSRTQIVFVYGGDLWIVGREGGDARRLTTGIGEETDPHFSPDGSRIAFTGEYAGNADVYVIPAAGGVPQRLTYHPARDVVVGWTPDGSRIVFRSDRESFSRFVQLFTVSASGDFPTPIALPQAYDASFSSDGARVAYMPIIPANQIWKRYRGGRTTPIWLARLSDASVEPIPRDNSNDASPMWIGNAVYFLSDRNGPTSLFRYDLGTKQVTEVVHNNGLDIKSASAGPDAIVYEQFGSIHLYDLASGEEHPVTIRVAGDLPGVRPHFAKVERQIQNVNLSPTGARAVFEARGEILTVPADKGDVRDLTNTPGVAERDPAWSPDGRWVAFFSDSSGEYMLHLAPQDGHGTTRVLQLGDAPGYYYSPTWSPDGKRIAYLDNRLQLWYIDLATGKNVKVDANTYDNPWRAFDPVWSPDGRWIAYTKQLPSHLYAVFVYSVESGRSTQITDGLSDARYPAFDKNGKYLYFTASTNAGPSAGWLDMSSYEHPVTRSVYLVVLRKDLPSPLAPLSDEEKIDSALKASADTAPARPSKAPTDTAAHASATPVRIDFDGIGQRIIALPIGARRFSGLAAGKTGVIFLLETTDEPPARPGAPMGERETVHKFDLATRKLVKLADGLMGISGPPGPGNQAFRLSANGERMLYHTASGWVIAGTAEPATPGAGTLRTSEMVVQVDPPAEWRQIYHEIWRIERDFFYDPNYHGLDLKAAEQRYAPYLTHIASRSDLTYLFEEMLGELTVGHLFVGGGDAPETEPPPPTGLLGADYAIENGRYRFTRIFNGENWNPQLHAPLTQPGVNVSVGEYLLAVNGREVRGTDNLYRFFEGTAGKSVTLRVGPRPTLAGSREVTVVPVASERGLRNLAWIEENRRTVDRLSHGRVAYVYLPNTGGDGYTNFNRYYFAQVGHEGVVIDERFNGGGSAADYMIDYMRRPLMNYWHTRYGADFTTPVSAIFGPKAMVINEYAGSGGDALPWYFREAKLGPLVGKRTWGGLVGIYDYPPLMDGGFVTAPRVAFWSPDGQWDVENHGVAPDIEVELDPKAWRAGHDTQLERAVAAVMDELAKHPPVQAKLPEFPNYHAPVTGKATGH
ncbi:MAG: PD40 domain-containing protein [Gemmatimonadaceae bacterium]|nr:PD40 domain-containing protein [Gemmatimonadaceae bacterium]